MKSYEGGAIPFSAMLGGRNTKKRSKKRVSRTRRKVKKTKTKTKTKTKIKTSDKISDKISEKIPDKTLNKCSCKIINDNSPNGLGFCAKCTPLNIIMRGKDKNLWKIEKSGKTKKWIKVN